MAKADSGCEGQIRVGSCWRNLDWLLVESSFFLAGKVASLWIDACVVHNGMLTGITAPFESALALVRGNCARSVSL
jgi:hypothetical protein